MTKNYCNKLTGEHLHFEIYTSGKWPQREVKWITSCSAFCLHTLRKSPPADASTPVGSMKGRAAKNSFLSVRSGVWVQRGSGAPAKWSIPSGCQWACSGSPPGCGRETRDRLQAELLWLPGSCTSLSCCRWSGQLWPAQPRWWKSPLRSRLKKQNKQTKTHTIHIHTEEKV